MAKASEDEPIRRAADLPIELRATGECATGEEDVVRRTIRVVEEVLVGRTVTDSSDLLQGPVGHTEAQVEELVYGGGYNRGTKAPSRHASAVPVPVRERTPQDALYASYEDLVQRATEVFGDGITASRWLSSPSADLGGQVPLHVVREDGYSSDLLEPIFARIEHGIDF